MTMTTWDAKWRATLELMSIRRKLRLMQTGGAYAGGPLTSYIERRENEAS